MNRSGTLPPSRRPTGALLLRLGGDAVSASLTWPVRAPQARGLGCPLVTTFGPAGRSPLPGVVAAAAADTGMLALSMPDPPRDLDRLQAVPEWLADHAIELGGDPDRQFLIGVEAGCGTALAVAANAGSAGWPPLVGVLLIRPEAALDPDQLTGASARPRGPRSVTLLLDHDDPRTARLQPPMLDGSIRVRLLPGRIGLGRQGTHAIWSATRAELALLGHELGPPRRFPRPLRSGPLTRWPFPSEPVTRTSANLAPTNPRPETRPEPGRADHGRPSP